MLLTVRGFAFQWAFIERPALVKDIKLNSKAAVQRFFVSRDSGKPLLALTVCSPFVHQSVRPVFEYYHSN